jgi:hypothetical protein
MDVKTPWNREVKFSVFLFDFHRINLYIYNCSRCSQLKETDKEKKTSGKQQKSKKKKKRETLTKMAQLCPLLEQ